MGLSRRNFIGLTAAGSVAAWPGGAFAVSDTVGGRVLAAGKGMAGVVVTDGLTCVETAADGSWSLPVREGIRFISVTPPSGWRVPCHYIRFAGADASYDFNLLPWPVSKPGPFTIMHIGDSEINDASQKERGWVSRAKTFADERDCAFFVHTGDICAAKGMAAHIKIMNFETVGRPVFYVQGNHDIISPEYGEETFEKYYGPCWYSLDAGGVHFVVTPMMWGDGRPSYTVEEPVAWLRNDLAIAKRKGQPVMLLTHGCYDTRIYDMRKLYSHAQIVTQTQEPFDVMAACDFRAIIHGHLHVNYFRRSVDRKIEVVSVAPPLKQLPTLQVIHVDEDRRLYAENRYGHGEPWKPIETPPAGGWLAKVPGIVFYGAPCVADGRVFVGTIDWAGTDTAGVFALDAMTGRQLWFHPTRSNVMAHILHVNGKVLVQDMDWCIYALDPATGREIWRFDARGEIGLVDAKLGGGASSQTKAAMTYDAKMNRVYTGTARKVLFAFNPDTGAVCWRTQDPIAQFIHTPSAPVVGEGVVVGSSFWIGLFGYDEKTGKELWRHTRNNSTVTDEWYRSGLPWIERMGFPVFKDGKLYLTSDCEFLEVEPRSGEPLRRKKFDFSVNCYTRPLFIGDRAYFGSQRKGLVCFDLKKFDLVWTAPVEDALLVTLHYQYPPIQSLSSCPVLWKGLVWAACQDGAVYAWDPATGERRERIFTGVPYVASATVACDKLYVADFTGRVRCFV